MKETLKSEAKALYSKIELQGGISDSKIVEVNDKYKL